MKVKVDLRWREYVWGLGILCERGIAVKENGDDVFEVVELTIMLGWLDIDIYFERKRNEDTFC